MRTERIGRVALATAAALAGAALLLRARPFRVAVEGHSMWPELRSDDFLIAVGARASVIRRGSLVVLELPQRPGFEVVKRVDGMPGEVRGKAPLERHEYWVLGDNPSASTDSRSFGPVDLRAIRGVVRLRYWPPRRLRHWATRG